MSTGIEWTDATWNPVTGCSKVSPGCAHCYAEVVAGRFWPRQYPPIAIADADGNPDCPVFDPDCLGADGECHDACEPPTRPRAFTDVMTHEDRIDQPLRWRRPRKVFVNSMSDLFHEDVPDAFIDKVFAVMALADRHTFQVLTKRAARMRAYFADEETVTRIEEQLWEKHTDDTTNAMPIGPLKNVWLGVSVENQHFADERIPLLLQTPAAVRFISAEPLLGPVDLERVVNPGLMAEGQRYLHSLKGYAWETAGSDYYDACSIGAQLDWVIVGGESGPGARPFDLGWGRSIVQQCQAAGVPVFVKQLGAKPRVADLTGCRGGAALLPDSSAYALTWRDRKGGDPTEWPADLRVRQWPGEVSR